MNDEEFTEFFIENTKEILGEDSVGNYKNPSMVEKMLLFPTKSKRNLFYKLNPKIYDGDKIYPHHHSKFDVEENLFYKGMCAV